MSAAGLLRWRPVAGGLILGLVAWLTGAEPFLAGLRGLRPATIALAGALALVATVACAWRWRLVAGALGTPLPLRTAVAACYRSQLLNLLLPGGVLGDLHRGLSHGQRADNTSRALRGVVWERSAGQVVLVLVAVPLLALPTPARAALPYALLAVGIGAAALVLLARPGPPGPARGTVARWRRAARADVRRAVLAAATWPGVVAASVVAAAAHLATFVVAARAVGVQTPLVELVPLTVLVLVAAGLPLNLAGWGPREGAAAWVFAAAGLGAATGVSVAVAFGGLVLVANLPGVVALLRPVGRPDGESTTTDGDPIGVGGEPARG